MKTTVILVVLLGLLGAGGAAYRSQSSCIIGVRGTRASVAVRGLGAMSQCKEFVANNRDYYLRTEAVTEPVLCEADKDRLHFTVRDEGFVVLVGRTLCGALKDGKTGK